MMRHEMRNEVHAIPYIGTLPRSLRRYEKRRERQFMIPLAMREYWQEDYAERNDVSDFMLDLDYADAYSNSDDDWKEYADTEKVGAIYSNDDDWDDYYGNPWIDYDYPRVCRCRECRPDLHINTQTDERIAQGYDLLDGVSLTEAMNQRREVMRKRFT
jgi:hypothetical protein